MLGASPFAFAPAPRTVTHTALPETVRADGVPPTLILAWQAPRAEGVRDAGGAERMVPFGPWTDVCTTT